MTALISQGSVGQYEAIVLENSYVRAVIIPELGGRVWELEDAHRQYKPPVSWLAAGSLA